MTNVCEVVITAPDDGWLADFVRRLLEDRLCAGAHQLTPIRSQYRWRGELHDRPESRVALHTLAEHVDAITRRANEQHPYEVPCVIALPVLTGNPAYLRWVEDEVRPPTQ